MTDVYSGEFVSGTATEGIGLVTVDRPPVNAYNLQTHRELHEAFASLAISEVRCVILQAAGWEEGRPFGAGSDIKEFVGLNPETSLERANFLREYMAAMNAFPLPSIAAIEQLAIGSGLGWAMRADIRVVSETACFAMPEIKVGALGGGKMLMRHVGIGKARELIYTGDQIDATEAYRLGLAQHLVAAGKALERAREVAERIARNSAVGLKLAKQQMIIGEKTLDLDEAYRIETELTAEYRQSKDAADAASGFFERRVRERPRQ